MFYSHQLLARKAPLGQIWMAATMHKKIDRKRLDKLNIVQICEEILNPSVPMALRLSGILMGGVVIVYERKVKILYDEVTHLLVEINNAWKVKAAIDPTVLPKAKSQAKYEAVTLPDNQQAELEEIEQSRQYYSSTIFQQTAYISMRLDNVDEQNPREDLSQHYHQADAANITLLDSYQAETGVYNRFERFDIEGDEETQLNCNQQEDTTIASTLEEPPESTQHINASVDKIQEQHGNQRSHEGNHEVYVNERSNDGNHEVHANQQSDEGNQEVHVNQQSDERKEASQPHHDQQRQGPPRKKGRRLAASVMDYEQTIIPGNIYQTWLQDASDIVSRSGRKRKHINTSSTMKTADLMDLPPVVLSYGLFANGDREVHYPEPLLKLWKRSIQPQNSPSVRMPPHQPPEPSSPAARLKRIRQRPMGFPFEDFQSGVGSQSLGDSIEKQMNARIMEGLRTLVTNNEVGVTNANGVEVTDGVNITDANVMSTPGNSGEEVRSIPSSGSGYHVQSNNSNINSEWLAHGSGLEPVAEEYSMQRDPDFELARVSEHGLTPEKDLLVETGPTQTPQNPIISQHIDQTTDSIRKHLKEHFNKPGSTQIESLNQLAFGMTSGSAARLFYHTCVLASRDLIRVEQKVPYGDIVISRGAKM